MVHINKVKLFNGELRYAVVEPFTHSTVELDSRGNEEWVTKTEELPVEYKVGDYIYSAVFPLTEEGLTKAKEIQKLFNKKSR